MFKVYGCIVDQHDLRLVVLAGLVCVLACFTALSLAARARVLSGRPRLYWLAAAAIVTGCGIWATHFVAMLAFRTGLPAGYAIDVTVLSVAIAIAISGAGIHVALKPGYEAAGGAIVGLGIAAMHFTGMAAFDVAAAKHWDAQYVQAAIVIGVALAAPAMMAAWRGEGFRARLAGTGLLVLAICGMHFTAMAALTLEPDPTIAVPAEVLAPEWLAVAIAAITILIISLGLMGAIFDQHLALRSAREAEQLRYYVAELKGAKRELEATTEQLAVALKAAASGNDAKSQFLAAMSHELRTPLNVILGFSEILKDELFGPLGNPRYRDYMDSIFDCGSSLLGIINDILEFSKKDQIALEEGDIDVAGEIAACRAILQGPIDKAGVGFAIEAAPGAADAARRPAPGAPNPSQPAGQRHQVHAARRPGDRRRPLRGRAPRHRHHGHRHRHGRGRHPQGDGDLRSARRQAQPQIRGHRHRSAAHEMPGRAARRHARDREPARPRHETVTVSFPAERVRAVLRAA